VGGFMNNAVYALNVTENGSTYSVTDREPLLTSTHPSFRPVDVKIGPDGAVYVTDWYNPIIGHYQASYADPRRDKSHGRIWRITAKGRATVKQPNLAAMKPPQLLEQLRSPERWTRYQAKRLLFDAPSSEVLKVAGAWIVKFSPTTPDRKSPPTVTPAMRPAETIAPVVTTSVLSGASPP